MRAVVIDQLSGRQVAAGPEETDATQPLIYYLTQRLGWKPGQLMAWPQWRVPKSPSGSRSGGYPVDIAIFDSVEGAGAPERIRIICECKAPTAEEGIDQLKTYLSLEPEARMGIWFNGDKHRIVYKLSDRMLVSDYAAIPRPTDPLSPTESHPPLQFGNLLPPPSIRDIFTRLRDRIAAQDTRVNRDEFILNDLANLLICKIADEQSGEADPERHLAFQRSTDPKATGEAMRTFFGEVRTRYPSIFTDDSDRIHIDDESLHEVVKTLEPYRLLGYDRHAVGTAFQVLRGRALKGEEGAYFTPPPVVDCVVQILAPDHRTSLIDPACGTGGFLAASLDYVFETVDGRKDLTASVKERVKRDWAKEALFAVDKDEVSTKLCKAYLTLLGDGRGHVFRGNFIDRADWTGRSDITTEIRPGRFDMVMMNPPFGQKLTVSEEVGKREKLDTCRKWRFEEGRWVKTEAFEEQQLGIAFFERGLALLKDGGRMAIVLPETFLFSKTFRWFVDWMCRQVSITHIVDIPMVAFEEFCRAKTCILFIQKVPPTRGHQIVMSFPRSIGQDRKGKTIFALNEHGVRAGALDNELADATGELVGREYRGETRTKPTTKGENRYHFKVLQDEARERGILVPRFWWRRDSKAELAEWTKMRPSRIVTLGQLADDGLIEIFEGHGSPPGNARATGNVPYVKVTDLKNWRINENPTNFVSQSVADKLRRRGFTPQYGDLITPARASSNIGQFSLVLPWQTNILLTKEVFVIRAVKKEDVIKKEDAELDSFLLLALLSLKVVQNQFKTLVLMQTNREHLGDHWREVQVPVPVDDVDRANIGGSVRAYFDGIVKAHESWDELCANIDPSMFGTRP